MTKNEFNKRVDKCANYLEKNHHYVCLLLHRYFETSIIKDYYKNIINKRDNKSSGMFGYTYITGEMESTVKRRWENRKTSLEIFRQVMLDEKLYKEL